MRVYFVCGKVHGGDAELEDSDSSPISAVNFLCDLGHAIVISSESVFSFVKRKKKIRSSLKLQL